MEFFELVCDSHETPLPSCVLRKVAGSSERIEKLNDLSPDFMSVERVSFVNCPLVVVLISRSMDLRPLLMRGKRSFCVGSPTV